MNARKMIPIEDAVITYRNFTGERTQYNAEGNRNFNLVLTEAQYEMLKEEGFKIKVKPPRDEDSDPRYLLQVSVSYKNRPPKIVLINSRGAQRLLNEDTVGELDHIDIARIDMTINASPWSMPNGNSGIKAYLNSMYVTMLEDAFAAKYAEDRS